MVKIQESEKTFKSLVYVAKGGEFENLRKHGPLKNNVRLVRYNSKYLQSSFKILDFTNNLLPKLNCSWT